jgi:hypothetical protein
MRQMFEQRWFRVVVLVFATIGAAMMLVYQRRTGPTYPIRVGHAVGSVEVHGKLPRSHAGPGDAEVSLAAPSPEVRGEVLWRRYPTQDEWSRVEMTAEEGSLTAALPHQPPAGKIEYSVRLSAGSDELVLPEEGAAIIRFRDDVPAWVVIPHILFMFVSFGIAVRALLGALLDEERVARFVPWVLGTLLIGGFLLGPLMQKFAFGAYWTGWPLGGDWTDNKTLVALVAWIVAWLVLRKRPALARAMVLFGTLVMFAVYLIPHSVRGSELDWEEGEVKTGEQRRVEDNIES